MSNATTGPETSSLTDTPSETSVDPPAEIEHPRFARFAWGVLGYNLFVILWGAYVRATGSGAGCGNHWPTCNGQIVPRDPSLETLIEYSHRITSGLALLGVVVLLVLAYRLYPAAHRVRKAAAWTVALMLTEAGIGAGLVLFELVAENESIARALFMGTHLGNTFLLLAALTITAHWIDGGPAFRLRGDRLTRLSLAALAVTAVIGISGAVAALGDTLYPAESLAHGLAQDLSPTSHILIKLRVFHPFIAIAGSVLLLHYVATIRRQKRAQPARRWASIVNLLVIVQLAAGAINVVLLAPVWMQLVHLLLADALWIALVLAVVQAHGVWQPSEAT